MNKEEFDKIQKVASEEHFIYDLNQLLNLTFEEDIESTSVMGVARDAEKNKNSSDAKLSADADDVNWNDIPTMKKE